MAKFQRYFVQNESKAETQSSNSKKTIKIKVQDRVLKKNKNNAGFKGRKKFKYENKPTKINEPIPEELLKKYRKGDSVKESGVRTLVNQVKIKKKEENVEFSTEISARAEILLTEHHGYLENDPGETTTQFTQKQIAENVDITAAAKRFDLKLEFGPYRAKYTRNGRHLLLGGQKGHVAAFDWVTKRLHCELNVMESIHDISWLHIETMFAVAQKDWVYIYDNQGVELHCVKRLNKVTRMEFLPYHFLLATCSDEGYLSWLDISIGKLVKHYNTRLGRLTMLTQNPWNAVLCVGHAKGVVSMWSPNSNEPLAKMLCHKAPMTALHVDPTGTYMATAASNRELKIWDIRKLEGPLQEYKLITAANNLAFSQKNMLALGMGNVLEIYRDCCATSAKRAYMRHRFNFPIGNFNFCPYEDILGVTTTKEFSSLIVPGSGKANFDALEANPYETKSQRREKEVKALLEKIQPELINLQPFNIAEVDIPTLSDKIEAQKKLLFVKPPKVKYEQRNKAKGKGGSVKMAKNKKIVQQQAKKEFFKNVPRILTVPQDIGQNSKRVIDRFVPKRKK